MSQAEQHHDVVIAGGGPAGAAAARGLATAGFSVLLVDPGRAAPRPGETLAPTVRPLLAELGVWARFAALGSLPSAGTRSVWGDREPVEHSHLGGPYGPGWHVDRAAVDRMLVEAALDAGVTPCRATAVVADHDGTRWRVTTSTGEVACRVLIDATGRRAGVGRALGAERIAFDRLTALATTWPADVRREGYLLVETAPDGWWYSAPLPAGALVAVLLTDADLCRRTGLRTRLPQRLAAAPATAARSLAAGRPAPPPGNALNEAFGTLNALNASFRASAPAVVPATSHRLVRVGDHRPWLAIGDAALAVDPVTGSGMVRALRSAAAGVALATRLLDRPADAAALLAGHESARNEECTAYLTERARLYARERRFATPFWTRRTAFAKPFLAAS
ncbi:tryptophan 7-halogenase [Actinophytocola sediminis]